MVSLFQVCSSCAGWISVLCPAHHHRWRHIRHGSDQGGHSECKCCSDTPGGCSPLSLSSPWLCRALALRVLLAYCGTSLSLSVTVRGLYASGTGFKDLWNVFCSTCLTPCAWSLCPIFFPFYWDPQEAEGLSWDSLLGQQVHFIRGKTQCTIWGTLLVKFKPAIDKFFCFEETVLGYWSGVVWGTYSLSVCYLQ